VRVHLSFGSVLGILECTQIMGMHLECGRERVHFDLMVRLDLGVHLEHQWSL